MTIKYLKEQIEKYLKNGGSEDDIVVISSDAEGNSYREMDTIYQAYCYNLDDYELELTLDDCNKNTYPQVIVLS